MTNPSETVVRVSSETDESRDYLPRRTPGGSRSVSPRSVVGGGLSDVVFSVSSLFSVEPVVEVSDELLAESVYSRGVWVSVGDLTASAVGVWGLWRPPLRSGQIRPSRRSLFCRRLSSQGGSPPATGL